MEAKGAQDGGGQNARSAEEGWITAGRQKSRKAVGDQVVRRVLGADRVASGHQREQKKPPRKVGGGPKGRNTGAGTKGGARNGRDQGDGQVVFEQLRTYLLNGAPGAYVTQTVVRLNELARERRFREYVGMLPAHMRRETPLPDLKTRWGDAIPYRLREQYEGLSSVWNMRDQEHQNRMKVLMHQWIVVDKVKQTAIEDRLRFFEIEHAAEAGDTKTGVGGENASYLTVVRPDLEGKPSLSAEQERLRSLCLQPVMPVSKLRKRTVDESAAILLILSHAIEVPRVPPFLTHSMTPGELAVFEDLFMALDYPLYAHLAPGQRFHDNMDKSALFGQMYCGQEAAPAHKQKLEQFKSDVSRATLDMKTRVLKVTFKGRQIAAKWAGWQLPIAARMITLVDYDHIRERAKKTHELVLLDFYSFEVEVRKGAMTSRSMYGLLANDLGLSVQALEHTLLTSSGLQEKQWQVRVRAAGCPEALKEKSYIVSGDTEVVVHHSTVHVNWPCKRCLSPEHPTRFCKGAEEILEALKAGFTKTVETAANAEGGERTRSGKRSSQVFTMAQLEALLRAEAPEAQEKKRRERIQEATAPSRSTSPAKGTQVPTAEKLVLPTEWGQSRGSTRVQLEHRETELTRPSQGGDMVSPERGTPQRPSGGLQEIPPAQSTGTAEGELSMDAEVSSTEELGVLEDSTVGHDLDHDMEDATAASRQEDNSGGGGG